MDQQIETRLQAIEQKLAEIEEVVVKTRKVQKRAATIKAVYWVFLILLGLGAFYFIQPVLDELKGVYGFNNNSDSQSIDDFLSQIQGQNGQ